MAEQDKISLGDLVKNTTRATRKLEQMAQELDDGLGDWIAAGQPGQVPSKLVQTVDIARQTAECLVIVLTNLHNSKMPDHDIPIADLTSGVFLETVRNDCVGDLGSSRNPY